MTADAKENAGKRPASVGTEIHFLVMEGRQAFHYFLEAYPSAYHPPPFKVKVQLDRIFLAFLPHLGQTTSRVSTRTISSVISPHSHLNS
jgi:hypothetical protein